MLIRMCLLGFYLAFAFSVQAHYLPIEGGWWHNMAHYFELGVYLLGGMAMMWYSRKKARNV